MARSRSKASYPVTGRPGRRSAWASEGTQSAAWICVFCIVAAPCVSLACALAGDHKELFVVAVIACSIVTAIPWLLVFRSLPEQLSRNPFLLLFAFFAFAAQVDLHLALTIDGFHSLLRFYLNHGEKYLDTPHGSAINWWDGTVHFLLYLHLIRSIIDRKNHRDAGLFWLGSVGGSLVVLVLGLLTGEHSGEIQLSVLLNLPFVLVPACFCVWSLQQPCNKRPASRPVATKAMRYFTIIICAAVSTYLLLRYMASQHSKATVARWMAASEPYLVDQAGFQQVQSSFNVLYVIPTLIFLCSKLQSTGTTHHICCDVAIVLLGALCQSQFSYVRGAMWSPGHHSVAEGLVFLLPNMVTVAAPIFVLACL